MRRVVAAFAFVTAYLLAGYVSAASPAPPNPSAELTAVP